MDRAHGVGDLALVHREGDVQLGRPLRDREDVHARDAQRPEDATGDAGVMRHPDADGGDEGELVGG